MTCFRERDLKSVEEAGRKEGMISLSIAPFVLFMEGCDSIMAGAGLVAPSSYVEVDEGGKLLRDCLSVALEMLSLK